MVPASPSDPQAEGLERLRQRLVAGWRHLAGIAAVLVVLAAAGALSPWAGLVIIGASIALVALLPRRAINAPADPAAPLAADTAPASQEILAHFAEALAEPCYILDRRGTIRFANARALAAFPARPGEGLTTRLRAPDLIAALDRVSRGGGGPVRVEFGERVPTERWFGAWFAPLDAGNPQSPIILTIEDMSERRSADRVRVDFVANASHELRTPLASLAGFIETLLGPAKEDPSARERFLRIMQQQAERMSRLVDDLLSLSRIEMKAHLRPSETVDVGAVIEHVVDALEPLARDLGVKIETAVPEAPLVVTGDRDELTQVFENLIENAIKYGQGGERVIVTLGVKGGPFVSVRDFGPGIPAEHIPRLTERFYRVDLDASRRHRGTGLGLAIVKHILARHQARLTIQSVFGEGATFTVTFPQVLGVEQVATGDKTAYKSGS